MKILMIKKGFKVEEIKHKNRYVFIIAGKTVWCADPSTGSLWVYKTEEERKQLLCKEHQEIVNKYMEAV